MNFNVLQIGRLLVYVISDTGLWNLNSGIKNLQLIISEGYY